MRKLLAITTLIKAKNATNTFDQYENDMVCQEFQFQFQDQKSF